MRKRIFTKLSFLLIIIVSLLVFTSSIFAQGQSNQAFERVRAVKERNVARFMSLQDVEGIGIGLDNNNQIVLKVFTSRPGVGGIPANVEGVPVQVNVSGRFYALKPPANSPSASKKPPKNTTAPTAPSNLSAIASQTEMAIGLTWQDNSDNENGFVIEAKDESNNFIEIGDVGANITSFSDTGLAPSTTYTYRVCAYNSAGDSTYSNEAQATTLYEVPAPIVDRMGWCSRPVPIGVSTGHPNITAGTIGCRVKDKDGNLYALSNNHVYANMNKANIGDNVLQPGPYDGGINPIDAIGVLFSYVPIKFYPRGTNNIDAAIALIDRDSLGMPLVGNATPLADGYGMPKSNTASTQIGLLVQKYGRTTGLTHGIVDAVNFEGFIIYGGRLAYFVNQIVITTTTTQAFSAGGDSGSLIITENGKNPVGLLFAGSDTETIANPIDAVLNAFGVTIDGE